MPRVRASLWPSKVKFTSSMPWRSAAAPNVGLGAAGGAAEEDAVFGVHGILLRPALFPIGASRSMGIR